MNAIVIRLLILKLAGRPSMLWRALLLPLNKGTLELLHPLSYTLCGFVEHVDYVAPTLLLQWFRGSLYAYAGSVAVQWGFEHVLYMYRLHAPFVFDWEQMEYGDCLLLSEFKLLCWRMSLLTYEWSQIYFHSYRSIV